MKRLVIAVLLVCCGACIKRATKFRSEFRNCTAAAGGEIVCNGRQAAQVECYQPRSNSCRALAMRYADGERLWLFEPTGFDPDAPEASNSSEDQTVALQPQIMRDASLIWFQRSDASRGMWQTYEPLTGVFEEVDSMRIELLKERQGTDAVPLWTGR
jgi:hypothetical protein